MIKAARIHLRVIESWKSNIGNTLIARDLHEFPGVSNLRRKLREKGLFLDEPRWHTACKCCCNGTKHETSRTLLSDSHRVSLVSRVPSRRVVAGLCRTGRIRSVTAPSLESLEYYRDGRAVCSVRPAGRASDFRRDSRQRAEHGRELEREWNYRWECGGWNDRR